MLLETAETPSLYTVRTFEKHWTICSSAFHTCTADRSPVWLRPLPQQWPPLIGPRCSGDPSWQPIGWYSVVWRRRFFSFPEPQTWRTCGECRSVNGKVQHFTCCSAWLTMSYLYLVWIQYCKTRFFNVCSIKNCWRIYTSLLILLPK